VLLLREFPESLQLLTTIFPFLGDFAQRLFRQSLRDRGSSEVSSIRLDFHGLLTQAKQTTSIRTRLWGVLTITSRVLGPIAVQSRPIAELDRPKDGHPAGFFVVRGGAQRSLSEDVKLWQRNLIPLVPIVFGEIGLHIFHEGTRV